MDSQTLQLGNAGQEWFYLPGEGGRQGPRKAVFLEMSLFAVARLLHALPRLSLLPALLLGQLKETGAGFGLFCTSPSSAEICELSA